MALIILSLRRGPESLKAWTSNDPAAGNDTEAVTGEMSFLVRWLCKEGGEPALALKGNLSFDLCCFSQYLRTIATFSSA